MTNATEAAQAGVGFSLWPILLLHAVLETFADHAAKRKAMRKRPMPRDREQAVPGLLTSECHIRSRTASGAAILLSGKELTLADVGMASDPPDDHQIPPPRSAWETRRRFEAIARFHADPMTFIRRKAQRIAAARARCIRPLDPAAATIFLAAGPSGASHPLRIRAPP